MAADFPVLNIQRAFNKNFARSVCCGNLLCFADFESEERMEKPRMERRAGTRITNMIKHAEMIFEGNVLDCVQLDISSGGTRIYLDGSVEIPDVVTIQMYDGTSRRARRLWQRGSQIGFDFLTEHETDARDLALGPEGK